MKKLLFLLLGILPLMVITSCSEDADDIRDKEPVMLQKLKNRIVIDSVYTYIGDSIYNSWLNIYNASISNKDNMTKSLSPEDDAFFNRSYIVKSTEATLLYGRNYIYPGSILEANSVSDQKYVPVFINNRKPITVSMTLTHKTPKATSRVISSPSYSAISDYVKEMAIGGSFEQNEKFMFQNKRFTFYDEIKSVFGTNINTRKLFSSKKESSTEEREKIVKSSGMYVKFYQSSFTVNMDAAPLSDQPIVGKTNEEPVYVNSVTYGRLGVLVFETDETYEFAESCIKKEFDRIFSKKTTTLTEKERLFFENTEFKVLIIGADSDYAVQTIRGYGHFLNLIYNSKFTETSFGVPISCTFASVNTHELFETEFENKLVIEPLFVKFSRENVSSSYDQSGSYNYHSEDRYLCFYKDRSKSKQAIPYIDIVFEIDEYISELTYSPDLNHWPMIKMDQTKNERNILKKRNIDFKPKIYIGREIYSYESTGKAPMDPMEPMYMWRATEYMHNYNLKSSPFYIIIY